jgi:exosortase
MVNEVVMQAPMQSQADTLVRDGVVETFWADFRSCWDPFPNKELFLGLLAAWVLLFQFLGNSTFGYIDTPSLFGWLYRVHTNAAAEAEQGPGMLAPFLVLALFWLKRKDLVAVEKRTWAPALGIVITALGMHALGYLVQQPRLSIVALFVGIYGMMGLAWGPRWLRASFFPYFLLLFMVPLMALSTVITFPLRLLVTVIVEFIARFVLGMDVVRMGTGLFDPSRTYQYDVAPACSGLRSLTAIFFLATVYGYALFRASWRWLVLLVAAFPLAVIGNAIRLLAIVVAADWLGREWGDYIHESPVFSMLPYVPVFFGLIWVGRWLAPKSKSPAPVIPEAKP